MTPNYDPLLPLRLAHAVTIWAFEAPGHMTRWWLDAFTVRI